MRAYRRTQRARPQGMGIANLLREAKGCACLFALTFPPNSPNFLKG